MAQILPFAPPERNRPKPKTELQRLMLLAQRRGDWHRAHPDASLEEALAAHRAIAEELGL